MKRSNLLWGLLLIIVGVIFGINALGIADINIFFDGWWTLFIIVPCFIGLFNDKDKTGNIIGLIIGVALLCGCLGVIEFEIIGKLFIPVVLVLIGISIMFKDTFNKKISNKVKEACNDNEYYATFSGQDISFKNEKFDGCKLNAVFGGVKCNLVDSKISSDCYIAISSIFGGVELTVPDNVNVKVSSIPLFGGVSDDRKNVSSDNKYTIYINATCMFGGVSIK